MDETWRNELSEFTAIPSVSPDPAHRAGGKPAGEGGCDLIRRTGGPAAPPPLRATALRRRVGSTWT